MQDESQEFEQHDRIMRLYIVYVLVVVLYYASNTITIVTGDERADDAVPDNRTAEQLTELLNSGRPQDALELIYSLPEQQQKHLNVRLALGRTKVQLGDKAEGEKILLQCAVDEPESWEAALLLARLYVTDERWDEAEAHATAALAIHPTSSQALALLSKVYLGRDEDIDKARLYLKRAVSIDDTDVKVLFEYGMLLFLVGEDEHGLAKETFDRMCRLDPSKADHKLLAKVYLYYKHRDWARLELMKMHPSRMDAESMLLLADCCDAAGDVAEATEWYERVLQKEPHNALAHGALGLMMLGCGSRNYGAVHACGLNQEAALRHLQVALQLEPTSGKGSRLRPVEEAVEFCQKEIQEVKSWRQTVNGNVTESETTADTGSEAVAPTATVGTSISKDLLAPLAAAKKIASLLRRGARLVLSKLGLCAALLHVPYVEVICRDGGVGDRSGSTSISGGHSGSGNASGSSTAQMVAEMKKVGAGSPVMHMHMHLTDLSVEVVWMMWIHSARMRCSVLLDLT